MPADTQIAVTESIKSDLEARKQGEYEPFHAVIRRLLDHSEATQAERDDAENIAAEVRTALRQGDVPVTLAEGEAERIATEVEDE